VLDGLNEGVVVNEITVPDDIAEQAKIALDRMLAVV
jgi:quinolinate synthase